MATAYLSGDTCPVIIPRDLSAAATILAQFDRAAIGTAIEVLVGLLDAIAEDPDVEENGDELDGSAAEDDFALPAGGDGGPGCTISDSDFGAEEDGEEEWLEDAFVAHRDDGAPGDPIDAEREEDWSPPARTARPRWPIDQSKGPLPRVGAPGETDTVCTLEPAR